MDFLHLFHAVNKDRRLRQYAPLVRQLAEYVRTTSRCSFLHRGAVYRDDVWQDVEQNAEYLHRFTVTYRRGVVAKMYQLDDWWDEHRTPVTLLTLTTYQDGAYSRSVKGRGLTIPEAFLTLKTSWDSLRKSLRFYLHDTQWVWVVEPHQSGYPHLHVAVFADVERGTQEAIKRLWSEKYGAASYEHGADFDVRKPSGDISSIRNYLLKYLAKGFITTGSKFGEDDDWTPGQAVFYALAWREGWRLFGATKDLCRVMAYKKDIDERTEWYATELLDQNGEKHEIWKAEGVMLPVIETEDPVPLDDASEQLLLF